MPVKVLFVCLGNICRSPTAEGVFRAIVHKAGLSGEIKTDSCGTAAYHVGEPPDPRSQDAAKIRGFDLSDLRARRVTKDDFVEFDYVLAMDRHNLRNLRRLMPFNAKAEPALFLDFGENLTEREVPDPYYGGPDGFETVLDLIERASVGLLRDIRHRFGSDWQ